ncbi:hypothetical protein GLYMA_06G110450v4 [Glycine max]|nr:hypothetical protein GLYMA_06G110450v4 [Glycine max]KAH1125309.1 hypothetical protein GYH30_014742 [Glycine max]
MARKPRSYPSYWTTFCVSDLAVFVIVGVLKGYLLQKLFGPGVADVTSDQNILYLDFPSNMVCLFLPLLHNCMHRLSDASLDF